MQELTVIGVEDGALLVGSEDGARFRIEVDETLLSRLRQAQRADTSAPKITPREAQAHIRSGLSAEEVAQITGASIDFIRRFEGPVLAEREHIVTSALGVAVHPAPENEQPDGKPTFGGVLRERLAKLGASGERWASWKEEERGWIVKLEFIADGIDHDARWLFEPRKLSLHPINTEAFTLSQQGEMPTGMVPRLRAVSPDSESSRFDSGAFTFDDTSNESADEASAPSSEPLPYTRQTSTAPSSSAASRAAIKRADDPPQNAGDTADLLQALRRRRGERETDATPIQASTPVPLAPVPLVPNEAGASAPESAQRSTAGRREKSAAPGPTLWGAVAKQKAPSEAADAKPSNDEGSGSRSARKRRASMPSWDEIVFGARPDDDPA